MIWDETAVNWEDEDGLWEGLVAPVISLGYFDTGSSEYLIIADGSDYLKAATEDGTFTLLTGATFVSGAKVRFAQLNNRMYYTDGSADLRYVNGSVDPVTAVTITAGQISSITISEGAAAILLFQLSR